MSPRYPAYSLESNLIYAMAMPEVRLHNLQSLAHFAHPLELRPWQIWRGTVHQPLRYLLVRRSLGVCTYIQLSSTAAEHNMGVQNLVLTNINGRIICTLSEFLNGLGVPELENCTGSYGFDLQNRWWSARGKFCDFLDLPDLVQHTILLQLAGDVDVMLSDTWSHPRCSLWTPVTEIRILARRSLYHPEISHEINSIPWDILRTNKIVRRKMQRIMRYHVTKHFARVEEYDKLTFLPIYADLTMLTRMQLAQCDRDFLHFFGADVECTNSERIYSAFPGCPGVALSLMSNVRYLELCFESIHSCEGCLRPCVKLEEDEQDHDDDDDDGGPRVLARMCKLERPCRRAMVDYIMCFAYEYVKHIPKVNLTGYVKGSTKQKWLGILHIAYDRQNYDVQRLNERLGVLNSTRVSEWPRECVCPEPCGHPEWQGEHEVGGPGEWLEQNDGHAELEARSERKVQEFLDRYQFDYHDSHPPVTEEVIGEERRVRRIRHDDPYAW
ncbi:hypothetical protein LTR53_001502 [Teratosphaeriaceae sp. CCFEE 6253]|nr:hypothetical protein LTR53_001502 [Teratosphaeriaceae sp. CCFEE 6253]